MNAAKYTLRGLANLLGLLGIVLALAVLLSLLTDYEQWFDYLVRF